MCRFLARALLVLALAAPLPAAGADTACHATTLGTPSCSGGPLRPEPRPVIRGDTNGLERVRDTQGQDDPPVTFVPAGKRTRLGTTIIDAPGPIGTCVTDALGNMRCR